MAKAKKPIPEGYATVTPSLILDDTARAIAWYAQALGAEELTRAVGPDGKVMHAEIKIGNSRIMLSDAVMGGKSVQQYGGSPASLWLYVESCDELFARAVAAGATVQWPPSDMFWGDRFGAVVDPFGYRWSLATHVEDLTPAELEERQRAWQKQMAAAGPPPGAS